MTRFGCAILLVLGAAAGPAGGYGYARLGAGVLASAVAPESTAAAAERKILYYRDPSGAANYSATPRQDAGGRDYLPVYEDEEVSFEPGAKKPASTASGPRKVLYYRNPMGLPDISPVPKKDSMGMDYIPVYKGEEQEDRKSTRLNSSHVEISYAVFCLKKKKKGSQNIHQCPISNDGTAQDNAAGAPPASSPRSADRPASNASAPSDAPVGHATPTLPPC